MGILGELRASLDHAAGGQIATDLDRLYEFSLDQLSQANLTRTPTGVTNTLQVMRTLQEGWNGIIAN
jgi:flagellar protein FliS